MSLTLFGYKKCSTCRKAEKALTESNVDFEYIDITEQPPSKTQLKRLITLSGLPLNKWFNTSGLVYRELNLKDKLASMSEAEMIELLAGNGKLIKRPVVTGKDTQGEDNVTVGFKADLFETTWS